MKRAPARGYRIATVVVFALALAGAVVFALEKNANALVLTLPDNRTAAVASSLCPGEVVGSAAIQIDMTMASPVGNIVIGGGFANGAKTGLEDPLPGGYVGNFTVRFLKNVPDDDGDFPGLAFEAEPVINGTPIGTSMHVPANATPTGNMINSLLGPLPEFMVELDMPDVYLPSGPFWMEIFHSFYSADKGACPPTWNWGSATPGNTTECSAVSTTAPGIVWGAQCGEVFTIHVQGATGACCTDGPGTESECIETTRIDCETNHKLFAGEGTKCEPTMDCVLLLVELESVSVRATREGVSLDWTTTVELDTVGFRILRETPGSATKSIDVISSMIPSASAGLTGASYHFLDNSKQAFRAERYYIEDLDIYGRWTRHGPFAVDRTRRTDPGTASSTETRRR